MGTWYPIDGSRKLVQYNYYGKQVHGGITSWSNTQHMCRRMLASTKRSVSNMRHLSEGSKEKAVIKSKKGQPIKSLSEIFMIWWKIWKDNEEVCGLKEVEKRQLKQVMKESREMTWREAEGHTKDVGGNSSRPSRSGIKRWLHRSFTNREAEIPACRIDPYMFPSKQKSIKNMFSSENL